jgi:hypothetical protein
MEILSVVNLTLSITITCCSVSAVDGRVSLVKPVTETRLLLHLMNTYGGMEI